MERRYTAKELRAMSLDELASVGEALGLKFNKNHKRADRARRVLSAYVAEDLASEEADKPPSVPADRGEAKPAFEALLENGPVLPSDEDTATASPQPPRGGARPGAGRPEGMTDALAAYNRLPQQPHPAIKQTIEMLFDAWAVSAKCPEVKLTKDEAFNLALPWTQAAELTGVAQRIPPWLMVVVSCLWATATIAKSKAKLARDAAAARKQVETVQVGSAN